MKRTRTYDESLKNLYPKAKINLNGLSLVSKYSEEKPNFLLSSDEIGNVYFIDSLETELKLDSDIEKPIILFSKKIYKCHNGAVFDIDWHSKSTQFLTASGDSTTPIWDFETGKSLFQSQKHINSVRTIKSCPYNPNIFITGGRDGRLILWDVRLGKSGSFDISDMNLVENEENGDSYTGVLFYDDENTIITSQANNDSIKLWDLRRVSLEKTDKNNIFCSKNKIKKIDNNSIPLKININSYYKYTLDNFVKIAESMKKNVEHIDYSYFLFFQKKYSNLSEKYSFCNFSEKGTKKSTKGISSLYMSKSQDKILVNGIDHNLKLFSIRKIDYLPPSEFLGHKTSYYVKSVMSPCANYILSGSIDKNIYIWKKNNSKPFLILKNAHNGDINAVDWGLNNTNFIVSSGDDKVLLLWDFI